MANRWKQLRHFIRWDALVVAVICIGVVCTGLVIALRPSAAKATGASVPAVATSSAARTKPLLSGTTSTPMAPTAPSTERAVGVPLDFGLTDPLLPARSELTAKLEALVDAYYQIQPGDKPIDRYTRVSRLHWAGQKIVPASVLAKLYVGIPTTGDLGNMFLPPYNASMQHAKLTTPLAIVTVTGTQANVKMPITFDIVRSNHTVLTSYALPQVAWPASDWAYDHGHWRLTRFAP